MLTAVRQAIRLEVVLAARPAGPLVAELCYLPEDPYTVHLHLPPGPGTAHGTGSTWTFSRDLLGAGIGRACRLDDVRIWPAPPDHTRIASLGDGGTVVVQAARGDLLRFLDRSYAAVPAGSERRGAGRSSAAG